MFSDGSTPRSNSSRNKVFSTLQISVDQELEVLETWRDKSPLWRNPGGRLAIISFHSLEDRIVKHRLRESELLTVMTKKPIALKEDEINQNIRSRSAKLRVAERNVSSV